MASEALITRRALMAAVPVIALTGPALPATTAGPTAADLIEQHRAAYAAYQAISESWRQIANQLPEETVVLSVTMEGQVRNLARTAQQIDAFFDDLPEWLPDREATRARKHVEFTEWKAAYDAEADRLGYREASDALEVSGDASDKALDDLIAHCPQTFGDAMQIAGYVWGHIADAGVMEHDWIALELLKSWAA